ncbi:MAG: DUF4249 family protein, partial [Chitinophagales bacterium]|nr:DUF4249 family protein [Chitinophagales bacterium]
MIRYFIPLLILGFASCTTEIDVDIPDPEEQLVVEGYIENGIPPYITLTRNAPFFGGIALNDVGSYFVNDAKILFITEGDTVELEEYCLIDLPPTLKQVVKNFLSFQNDSLDICLYTIPDILGAFSGDSLDCEKARCGKPGGRYEIIVEAEGRKLNAVTRIPNTFAFDSLTWRPHKDPENDSLVIVDVHLSFPDTLGNYVRYFTKRNSEPFYAPQTLSVYNDRLFVGTQISL